MLSYFFEMVIRKNVEKFQIIVQMFSFLSVFTDHHPPLCAQYLIRVHMVHEKPEKQVTFVKSHEKSHENYKKLT